MIQAQESCGLYKQTLRLLRQVCVWTVASPALASTSMPRDSIAWTYCRCRMYCTAGHGEVASDSLLINLTQVFQEYTPTKTLHGLSCNSGHNQKEIMWQYTLPYVAILHPALKFQSLASWDARPLQTSPNLRMGQVKKTLTVGKQTPRTMLAR